MSSPAVLKPTAVVDLTGVRPDAEQVERWLQAEFFRDFADHFSRDVRDGHLLLVIDATAPIKEVRTTISVIAT
jgi:hypothetical protein